MLTKNIKEIKAQKEDDELKIRIIQQFNKINKLYNKLENPFKTDVKKLFTLQKNEIIRNLKQDRMWNNIKQNIMKALREDINFKSKFFDINYNFTNLTYNIIDEKIYIPEAAKWTIGGAQFNFNEWVERFKEEGHPHIANAVLLAGEMLSEEMGSTFTLYDPVTMSYIGTRVTNYATITNETTKHAIDVLLVRAAKENLSIDDAAALIAEYYSKSMEFRASVVARTEIMSGVNLGRLMSMQQTPDVESHMWITQRDGKVRDSHDYLEGTVVKLGEPFPVSNDYGGDPTYPSDYNERCSTMPYKEENIEEKPDEV